MSQIHPQIQAILDRARQRAADNNLPYAGALTPPEAQQVLLGMPEAKLVDVRTQAEWQFVGTVPNAVLLEWKRFPGMTPNHEFIGQLQSVADPDATLLFMCVLARVRTMRRLPLRRRLCRVVQRAGRF